MEQKEFKLLVDTAQKRMDYLIGVNVWLNGYLESAEKTSMDGIKIDTEIVSAVKELKDRVITEIVKDAIFIAKHNINGTITWKNIPNVS